MTRTRVKILLMVPPLKTRVPLNEPYPPLGLAYMAACLERHGFDVSILDAVSEGRYTVEYKEGYCIVGLSEQEIRKRLEDYQPDIVGISFNFTNFFDDQLRIAKVVKDTLPNCVLVLGGAHVTMEYLPSIQSPFVDVIVRGEGEYTMVDLAERVNKGEPLYDIAGTVVKHNGRILENPLREPIMDLDALPMPAYHLLRMDIYLQEQRKSILPFAMRIPVGFMITSRGCQYNCIFCSTSKVFKKFRSRNPIRVVDEMEHLMRQYGVREIAFQDDCFLGNVDTVRELCNDILKRKLDIKWSVPPGLPVWKADKGLLKIMRDSGFYRVCFPIESGCQKTIHFIRKPVDLKKAKEVVLEANRLGLWTFGNLIIGFPYETKEEIDTSVNYFLDSELDMLSVFICQPYAGSDLYPIYVKEGLLSQGRQIGSNLFGSYYDTKHLTADELNNMRSDIISRFIKKRIFSLLTINGIYLHLLTKIRSLEDAIYVALISSQVIKASIKHRSLKYF